MRTTTKKKVLEIDERGRITLPKGCREGVGSFSVETLKDGSLHLVPMKTVSVKEAALLESLKASLAEYRQGKTKKMPGNWIE